MGGSVLGVPLLVLCCINGVFPVFCKLVVCDRSGAALDCVHQLGMDLPMPPVSSADYSATCESVDFAVCWVSRDGFKRCCILRAELEGVSAVE